MLHNKRRFPLFGCIPHFFAFCVDSTVPVLYTERYGTFAADRAARDEVVQMSNIFRANIIDVSRDTLTVAIFGDKQKTSALIGLLEDFGILEIAKTGTLAIERGRSTIYDDNKLKEEYNYGKNVL